MHRSNKQGRNLKYQTKKKWPKAIISLMVIDIGGGGGGQLNVINDVFVTHAHTYRDWLSIFQFISLSLSLSPTQSKESNKMKKTNAKKNH